MRIFLTREFKSVEEAHGWGVVWGVFLGVLLAILVFLFISIAAKAQQIDPTKPLTPEQYQAVIADLCQAAVWANRIRYGDMCGALALGFAAQKTMQPSAPAEPAQP